MEVTMPTFTGSPVAGALPEPEPDVADPDVADPDAAEPDAEPDVADPELDAEPDASPVPEPAEADDPCEVLLLDPLDPGALQAPRASTAAHAAAVSARSGRRRLMAVVLLDWAGCWPPRSGSDWPVAPGTSGCEGRYATSAGRSMCRGHIFLAIQMVAVTVWRGSGTM
jgi:hypothetical protein